MICRKDPGLERALGECEGREKDAAGPGAPHRSMLTLASQPCKGPVTSPSLRGRLWGMVKSPVTTPTCPGRSLHSRPNLTTSQQVPGDSWGNYHGVVLQ